MICNSYIIQITFLSLNNLIFHKNGIGLINRLPNTEIIPSAIHSLYFKIRVLVVTKQVTLSLFYSFFNKHATFWYFLRLGFHIYNEKCERVSFKVEYLWIYRRIRFTLITFLKFQRVNPLNYYRSSEKNDSHQNWTLNFEAKPLAAILKAGKNCIISRVCCIW